MTTNTMSWIDLYSINLVHLLSSRVNSQFDLFVVTSIFRLKIFELKKYFENLF